jgi:5,10-methylenetetrahydrofolate reductase
VIDWDEPGFAMLCEIEPATTPDLHHVRRQIAALNGVADGFLIPDNHLARATVSSIAVAHEVAQLGGHPVACVNSRDRNLLGFRRDLLTAAAYGVRDFLFVRGDNPAVGTRSGDLTVNRMIDEARQFEGLQFRVGATARAFADIPRWKKRADFLLVQLSFDVERLVDWRQHLDYDGKLLAGVMVLGSSGMARRLAKAATDIEIPESLIESLEADRDHGVSHALDMVRELRAAGCFDGVHLVAARRYQQVADRLR